MSNYYDMRDAKVRIAHELRNRGWKLYGYKEDKSDSMSDYYDPASWDGIAEKNGFLLCVDVEEWQVKNYSGKEVYSYNSTINSNIDYEKIKKLEAMTQANGATEGEETNAKKLIKKIKESAEQKQQTKENTKTLKYKYPLFMANPSTSKWHIEKDSRIYDKGTGITKYSDLPKEYEFDIIKMEYKEGYTHWRGWNGEQPQKKELTEKELKTVNDFKTFILKIESIVNGFSGMYDGTKENIKEAEDQQVKAGYEKKTITEVKKVLKMVQVERNSFKIGDYLTFTTHGGYWKITGEQIRSGTWQGIRKEKNSFSYEIVGSEKRKFMQLTNPKRYYDYEDRMLKDLKKGNIKIFELKEVEEITEVEKWVKIEKVKKTSKKSKEVITEQTKQTENSNIINNEYTITADTDTRDNSALWVVKIVNKLTSDEYIKVSEQMKKIKGYYSKFKHGFIFRYEPSEALKGVNIPQSEEVTTNKEQETADNIIDESTENICKLGLNSENYFTNEEYKNNIAEYVQKHNINITEQLLNYIEFEGLKNVLQAIKAEAEQKEQHERQQAEKNNLLEKINKNIESLQSKIAALSGDYQTNTYKRMREQESRDSKKESLEINIKLLEYVQQKLIDNTVITELEKALIVGAFRENIHQYYIMKYGRNTQGLKFPQVDYSLPLDGWYNKEVPTKQNKLKKYGITNIQKLTKAVEEYNIIYNSIDRYKNPIQQKIKKLENEYKLRQKGDINFTPKETASQMIEFANIDNNSRVLEPSAGIGNIADQIKAITEYVDIIEWNSSFAELLRLKNHNVIGNDLLEYQKYNYYDAIIMNPPFTNNQDIKHLQHAYKLLKTGGKLISLTSEHWTFANDKESQNFREWLEEKTYDTISLECGTFEMTNVKTRIIILNKEEETNEIAV